MNSRDRRKRARSYIAPARAEIERVKADAQYQLSVMKRELEAKVNAVRGGDQAALAAAEQAVQKTLSSLQQREMDLDEANTLTRMLRTQLALERSSADVLRSMLADRDLEIAEIKLKLASMEPIDKLRKRLANKSQLLGRVQTELCAVKRQLSAEQR